MAVTLIRQLILHTLDLENLNVIPIFLFLLGYCWTNCTTDLAAALKNVNDCSSNLNLSMKIYQNLGTHLLFQALLALLPHLCLGNLNVFMEIQQHSRHITTYIPGEIIEKMKNNFNRNRRNAKFIFTKCFSSSFFHLIIFVGSIVLTNNFLLLGRYFLSWFVLSKKNGDGKNLTKLKDFWLMLKITIFSKFYRFFLNSVMDFLTV